MSDVDNISVGIDLVPIRLHTKRTLSIRYVVGTDRNVRNDRFRRYAVVKPLLASVTSMAIGSCGKKDFFEYVKTL